MEQNQPPSTPLPNPAETPPETIPKDSGNAETLSEDFVNKEASTVRYDWYDSKKQLRESRTSQTHPAWAMVEKQLPNYPPLFRNSRTRHLNTPPLCELLRRLWSKQATLLPSAPLSIGVTQRKMLLQS